MENNLTICYIVKNSIFKLPESYEVMRNLSDKIIVVDTGSTDGTWQWADSREEIQLTTLKWCNDFSKARNYALKACYIGYDTKYILMMDDDEFIPETYHKELLKFLDQANKKFVFTFEVVNFLEDPQWIKDAKKLSGRIARMFEFSDALYYQGRVHERLICKNYISINLPIPIFHFQFKSHKEMLPKMKHRRKLILLDIRNRKPIFIEELHLANTYRESFRWGGKAEDALGAIKHLENAGKIKNEKFIQEEIDSLKGAFSNGEKTEKN